LNNAVYEKNRFLYVPAGRATYILPAVIVGSASRFFCIHSFFPFNSLLIHSQCAVLSITAVIIVKPERVVAICLQPLLQPLCLVIHNKKAAVRPWLDMTAALTTIVTGIPIQPREAALFRALPFRLFFVGCREPLEKTASGYSDHLMICYNYILITLNSFFLEKFI